MRPRMVVLLGLATLLLVALPMNAHASAERRFTKLVNHKREKAGLHRLRQVPLLTAIATKNTERMRARGTIDHIGFPLRARLAPGPHNGEVVLWQTRGPFGPRRAKRAFMQSPPHRAILMDPGARTIGVSVETRGLRAYWTGFTG